MSGWFRKKNVELYEPKFESRETHYQPLTPSQPVNEEDPSYYSVLIHFTPQGSFVYVLKDDEFYPRDGSVEVTGNVELSGNYVINNDLDSMDEVNKFVANYKLVNAIFILLEEDE